MKYIDPDFLRKKIEKRLKNVRDYMSGTGKNSGDKVRLIVLPKEDEK